MSSDKITSVATNDVDYQPRYDWSSLLKERDLGCLSEHHVKG